jgi:hypothetical protein
MENHEEKIDSQIPDPTLKRGRLRLPLPLILVGILLVVFVISVGAGYWEGNRQRAAMDQQQIAAYLEDQFNLALSDIQNGQYDFAQQRLKEIISRNPDYPGAQDAQKKVSQLLNVTATPIPTNTIIPTPTPNVGLGDQMHQKALQQYKDKDYQGMVQTLLTIQRDIPSYNPLRIEGLLYVGYQAEGMADIRALNLERGMYRLWLASRYAPLDKDSNDKIEWSRRVLSSFQSAYRYRKTDLEKSVINFSIVYVLAPGYRPNLAKDYEDTLDAYIKKISDDNCYIRNKLDELLANAKFDKLMLAKREAAADKCAPPAATTTPVP